MAFTRAQQIALDRDRWFAMKNPNAVSPQTYRQLVGDQEQNRVRAHEMAMLQQQQGRNDIGVQAEKNLGIEKEWAGRKGIAEMEEETKREANKARFGYHKDIGDGMTVYQNGSEATAARYAAGSASEAEKAKGEGLLALEKQKLETLKQEGVNAVNLENERTGGLIEVEDTRGKNAIALQKQQGADAMTLAKEQTRTAETRARIEAIRQNGVDAAARDKLIAGQINAMAKADPAFARLNPAEQRKRALAQLGYAEQDGALIDTFRE